MNNTSLKKTLNLRHVIMITIGGTIGTGLFVGVRLPLEIAGNFGALIAYILAGANMILVMMCLGELSSAMPHSGSFQHYLSVLIPNQYFSFSVGWMYWLSWVLTISADLTASSMVLHDLLPAISVPTYILIIISLLGAIHLYSAKNYGESETIFTSLKIVTIVSFLLAGLYLVFFDRESTQTNSLFDFSSSLPHGVLGIAMCMTAVTYAYQGIEMLATVVGESDEAPGAMGRIIKVLVVRVLLFYVLTTLLLGLLYPQGYQAAISPFVYIFEQTQIPHAGLIMKLVIIICGLSAASGAVYASSRLLWSMSEDGMAPKALGAVSTGGTPVLAIVVCLLVSCFSLVTQWYAPKEIYLLLISSTGQVGCFAWLCIAICLILLKEGQKKGKYTEFKGSYQSPLYPIVPIIALFLNLAFIVALWFSNSGLDILIGEAVILSIITIFYFSWFKTGRLQRKSLEY